MASSKLTLSIEPGIIEKAKSYAKKKQTSVSKLFEDYVSKIAESEQTENDPLLEKLSKKEIPDYIKSLTGILKGKYPDDYDFKEAKYEYLREKYDL